MSILNESPEFGKVAEAVPLSALAEVIPPATITQAIERTHSRGKRRRKLPAEVIAVAIVVLGLFAGATLRYAVLKTLQGLRLRSDFAIADPAGKSAICQARYRTGHPRNQERPQVVTDGLFAQVQHLGHLGDGGAIGQREQGANPADHPNLPSAVRLPESLDQIFADRAAQVYSDVHERFLRSDVVAVAIRAEDTPLVPFCLARPFA